MALIKRKKENIEVDERTELERSFEEKGQKAGRRTGEIVQKSVDKINKLKEKYDADGKIVAVKGFVGTSAQKVDGFVSKATTKGKEVVEKVKKK